ncbi:hypothetical protein TRVA0_031S01574 [Trichomonascus vanleenenianus]|uniref:uncharacterized protein n=1 Tax=Trichomonascus vanleenenianus TaxID=2268995 RepID=UPI003EC98CC0
MTQQRTYSVDSTYNIRKNPLSIQNSDGSDWVLDRKLWYHERDSDMSTGSVKFGQALPKANSSTDLLRRPESAVIVSREYPRNASGASQQSSVYTVESIQKSINLGENTDDELELLKDQIANQTIDIQTYENGKYNTREYKRLVSGRTSSGSVSGSSMEMASIGSTPTLKSPQDKPPADFETRRRKVQSMIVTEDDRVNYLSVNISSSDLHQSLFGSFPSPSQSALESTAAYDSSHAPEDLRRSSKPHGGKQTESELKRKNTITSQTTTLEHKPSQSRNLFEKLKTARNLAKIGKQPSAPHIVEFLTPESTSSTEFVEFIVERPKKSKFVFEEPATVNAMPQHQQPPPPRPPLQQPPSPDQNSLNSSGSSTLKSLNEPEKVEQPKEEPAVKEEESEVEEEEEDEVETKPKTPTKPVDKADRGRLFLRILGLRDVKMPIDQSRNPKFTITLDNGLQCVTTFPMNFTANKFHPINQEFELVVGEDLQLILTLNAHMDPVSLPETKKSAKKAAKKAESLRESPEMATSSSPGLTTPPASPKKKSRFNIFTLPKKKREEKMQEMAVEQEKKLAGADTASPEATRRITRPIGAKSSKSPLPQDPWRSVIGPQKEFARVYITESQVEDDIFGSPQNYTLSCYNEWTKAKDGSSALTGVYRIAGLQVTMLYIPKAYADEKMPKSLNGCMDILKEAANRPPPPPPPAVSMNGFLSQEGGDCSVWRRRWFQLSGSELRAQHEETRQVRMTFDLKKARRIVEYSEDPSAFYDPNMFRVEFSDQTINFLADGNKDKQKWHRMLKKAIARANGGTAETENQAQLDGSWVDMVVSKKNADKKGHKLRFKEGS